MRRAVLISTVSHVALLIATFVQVPWPEKTPEPVVVAEVSIFTEAEFDAAISQAPDVVPSELGGLFGPVASQELDALRPDDEMDVTINDVDGPDAPSAADSEADLSAVLTTNQVSARTNTASLGPTISSDFGSALSTPSATSDRARPSAVARPTGMARPQPQRPSLNIDTTPAAPPPEEAKEDEAVQEEIVESIDPVEVAEAQDATAPDEAATDIIPEIAEELPEDLPVDEILDEAQELPDPAPLTSAPPRPRPETLTPVEVAEETPAVEPTSEPTPEPAAEPTPEPAAEPTQTAQSAPAGPPLTGGEIGALSSSISNNWNLNSIMGLPDANSLIVTVAFSLDINGQVTGDVRPVSPSNPQGAFKQAFDAARRAILIASRNGEIRMPQEKYEQWRDVEITFDPSKGQFQGVQSF